MVPLDATNQKRVRVLFVDHTAAWGGGEVALLNLVTRLDRARFDPAVLLFADGPLKQKLDAANIATEVLRLSDSIAKVRKDRLGLGTLLHAIAGVRAMWFILRLANRFRRDRPDLIHTNSLKADLLAGLAGRLAGVPVIWHVRDRISDDYLPRKVVWIFRRLARWVPSQLIANSDATLSTLAASTHSMSGAVIYSGIDPQKANRFASVVHDGTDLVFPTSGNAPASRAFSANCPCIGLIGRISPWKGQHIFIRAAAHVHKTFPQARFFIIGSALFGEDQYEQEIRQLVVELGLSDVVEFTGFRNDIPALLAGLDVLAHGSTTAEPFGQVIIEAMAAGKPVVATRGGGVLEIVVDRVTGILVPMGDAPAMAIAIIELLQDKELRHRMGEAGRARVIERFTIDRTARDVEAVYERLLGVRQ